MKSIVLVGAVLAIFLMGCQGDRGKEGKTGLTGAISKVMGPQGETGPIGEKGTDGCINSMWHRHLPDQKCEKTEVRHIKILGLDGKLIKTEYRPHNEDTVHTLARPHTLEQAK